MTLPATAFALVAEFTARPGAEEALRAVTLPLVANALGEPTTLVFDLHEDREAPGHFVLYEAYVSVEAHAAHVAGGLVQAWFARLPDLTRDGLRVIHLRPLTKSVTLP